MNVKILKKFRDKYTGEIYEAGQIIELDENRFNEILAFDNFVEKVAVEQKVVEKEVVEKPKRTRNKK